MDIVIISNYWHFEFEKTSSRYLSIAHALVNRGHDVEVVTSTFYHANKCQRTVNREEYEAFPYKTQLIYEPGYRKNVDLRRMMSHKTFAKNTIRYLSQRKRPDVIYLFMPPIDLAYYVTRYAKKKGIRLIIDILDLWPEAFEMVLPFSRLTKHFLFMMKKRANFVYKNADSIVAVSQTYVDRATKINKKERTGAAVYIGVDRDLFDSCAECVSRSDEEFFKVAYIGMLGTSYNIKCVIDAIAMAQKVVKKKILFVVMGDGPRRTEFETYAKEMAINAEFLGRLPYEEMVVKLCQCDVAVNPIVSKSAASIINKVADYAAAGLPVLNTQNNIEYIDLLRKYNSGISFPESEIQFFSDSLVKLIEDDTVRLSMGENSRRMFEELFDRASTYEKIVNVVETV